MAKLTGLLSTPLFDRLQNIGDGFVFPFGAEITFAVDADADCVGLIHPRYYFSFF
jgi:hypothetical protein